MWKAMPSCTSVQAQSKKWQSSYGKYSSRGRYYSCGRFSSKSDDQCEQVGGRLWCYQAHLCKQEYFTSYTSVGDGEEHVNFGDFRTTPILGKGKVILKLTSGKTLALSDVLHVSSIRVNLISVALLGKVGVKVSFEFDKIVMTKNNVFMGKENCDQGLFVLNISEIINESCSSTYIVNSWYVTC